MINKGFIRIERINKEMFKRQFQYRRSLKSWFGLGLVGVGVATLPLPTGSPVLIGLGIMLINPISLKSQLRNKKEDIKHALNKRLMFWGLI